MIRPRPFLAKHGKILEEAKRSVEAVNATRKEYKAFSTEEQKTNDTRAVKLGILGNGIFPL